MKGYVPPVVEWHEESSIILIVCEPFLIDLTELGSSLSNVGIQVLDVIVKLVGAI